AAVSDEAAASRGDVDQTIPDFADRRDVMRAPALEALVLHREEDVTEPFVEITERLDAVATVAQGLIGELAIHESLGDEVDERVGFGVDVVAVQEHLRILEH